MSFTFTLNPEGVKRVAQGKPMLDFVDRATNAALSAAQDIAPVESAEYLGSLGVTKAAPDADGNVTAGLHSTSSKWHWIEFGTAEHQAHHVLERAVTSLGIEFKAQGR